MVDRLISFGMSCLQKELNRDAIKVTKLAVSGETMKNLSFRPKGDHEVAARLNLYVFTGYYNYKILFHV
jgi:hypothetical protein